MQSRPSRLASQCRRSDDLRYDAFSREGPLEKITLFRIDFVISITASLAAGRGLGQLPRMLEIDLGQTLDYLLHLLAAYALALPCALDREQEFRSAGLRTYPLVAIGACAFLLLGAAYLPDDASNARLMQGLIGKSVKQTVIE